MRNNFKLRYLTWSALVLLALAGCNAERQNHPMVVLPASVVRASVPPSSRNTPKKELAPVSPAFREVATEAGLNYEWRIPGKRPLNILQTIGNGCAFLDYDSDTNLDILLVGTKLALYRGDGKGHFTEATVETGLNTLSGHFLGCAVGDYDNDGFDDLYISGYRTGLLLHNEAGKRFRDITQETGLKPQPWGSSCGFADLDGDGWLDLYVANYVEFDPKTDMLLCPFEGHLTGCGPRDYAPSKGILYKNEGGKRFRNVTQEWGAKTHGRGLGIAFADFDGSGRMGLAVANDLLEGDLFCNLGNGKLQNIGRASGTAFDDTGDTHAGMGADWGDYDNDGKFDLFVTTFGYETKCLYHNEGDGLFTIKSEPTGVEGITLPYVAWGCKFFDADNDGWLDLLIANGHVQDNVAKFEKASYRQPLQFLRNRGGASPIFEDGTRRAKLDTFSAVVGRGLAIGDYDNDGSVDALVVDSEGKPLLLHNETQMGGNQWIGLCLVGSGRSNRSGYGAVITIEAAGKKRVRQCHPGGSYLSSSDRRVHFGLGGDRLERIRIRWPDGSTQTLTDVPTGQYVTIREESRP